jgi:hypothetical protein
MSDDNLQNFRRELIKLGILSYSEQDRLYDIALRCARTSGVALGGAGAVMGAGTANVMLPIIGTVPGAVAGFLAGLATGTMACTALHYGMKDQLRALLD